MEEGLRQEVATHRLSICLLKLWKKQRKIKIKEKGIIHYIHSYRTHDTIVVVPSLKYQGNHDNRHGSSLKHYDILKKWGCKLVAPRGSGARGGWMESPPSTSHNFIEWWSLKHQLQIDTFTLHIRKLTHVNSCPHKILRLSILTCNFLPHKIAFTFMSCITYCLPMGSVYTHKITGIVVSRDP